MTVDGDRLSGHSEDPWRLDGDCVMAPAPAWGFPSCAEQPPFHVSGGGCIWRIRGQVLVTEKRGQALGEHDGRAGCVI